MPDRRRQDVTKTVARGGGTRTERCFAEMVDSELQDSYGEHFPDLRMGMKSLGLRDFIFMFCLCFSNLSKFFLFHKPTKLTIFSLFHGYGFGMI